MSNFHNPYHFVPVAKTSDDGPDAIEYLVPLPNGGTLPTLKR
jgi:hypothetical protein